MLQASAHPLQLQAHTCACVSCACEWRLYYMPTLAHTFPQKEHISMNNYTFANIMPFWNTQAAFIFIMYSHKHEHQRIFWVINWEYRQCFYSWWFTTTLPMQATSARWIADGQIWLYLPFSLAFKYQNMLSFSLQDCSLPISLPPLPTFPGETHGCFSDFAFVYLALCSELPHYLSKWRHSLPTGS